jgi:hypothetical protein
MAVIRTLIKLALVALIANALVHAVPVYWSYFKFKDAVQETARFSGKRTERDVQERVLSIANRFEIPVDIDDIRVRKDGETTFVDTAYDTQIEYFPGRSYPVHFDVKVEGVPPRFSSALP